jgi:hypothetical protein
VNSLAPLVALILGAGMLALSCQSRQARLDSSLNSINHLEFDYVDPSPEMQFLGDAGPPVWKPRGFPIYPEGEILNQLADCQTGEPVCQQTGLCLGWVVFLFKLDPERRPVYPELVRACPSIVLTGPLLDSVKQWKFVGPTFWGNGLIQVHSTIVAYPIQPNPAR